MIIGLIPAGPASKEKDGRVALSGPRRTTDWKNHWLGCPMKLNVSATVLDRTALKGCSATEVTEVGGCRIHRLVFSPRSVRWRWLRCCRIWRILISSALATAQNQRPDRNHHRSHGAAISLPRLRCSNIVLSTLQIY
jgi:hypothetical protein